MFHPLRIVFSSAYNMYFFYKILYIYLFIKIYNLFFHEYSFIKAVVKNAIKTKEIRDLDAEEVAHHLRYIFIGCAFEESFNNGLTVEEVQKHLMFYYNIIKR